MKNNDTGDKASLAAVIACQQIATGKVSGFVRRWRTRQDANCTVTCRVYGQSSAQAVY